MLKLKIAYCCLTFLCCLFISVLIGLTCANIAEMSANTERMRIETEQRRTESIDHHRQRLAKLKEMAASPLYTAQEQANLLRLYEEECSKPFLGDAIPCTQDK